MANYITNKLKIVGSKEKIQKVFDFIKIEKDFDKDINGIGTIDFNKITPMPKWVYNKNLGFEDELKYGSENCWRDWSIKNWGTKWNAFGQKDKRNTVDTIYFQTAWNGIPNLIRKLAWIFQDIIIEYSYCNEDFGYGVGRYKFKDTEILEEYLPTGGTKEAYELAFEITGESPESMDLMFDEKKGTFIYK